MEIIGCIKLLFRGMAELIGILVGHLYFFMKYQYPEQYGGAPMLTTPQIV